VIVLDYERTAQVSQNDPVNSPDKRSWLGATLLMMKLYLKPTWTTCRNAKSSLRERGVQFEEVDLNKGLSVAELDRLIGKRDYKEFLNTRNELYRERGMKENPPSRAEALKLMSENPNLIKRPILVDGEKITLGSDVK
jgi:arsenate reductase-like glutaredoxin family protein